MPKLQLITRADIAEAIARLKVGEAHVFGAPTRYALKYEGQRFPPKAVVGLAARRSHGRDLSPDEFSSGVGPGQAVAILRDLGFDVIEIQAIRIPRWTALLQRMRRESRIYKPAAILCLLDLLDEGASPEVPISTQTFRDEFVRLMADVGPGLGEKWWEPFFHLHTDKLWTLTKEGVPASIGTRPKTGGMLLAIADSAVLATPLAREMATHEARQAIRDKVLELLGTDKEPDSERLLNAYFRSGRSRSSTRSEPTEQLALILAGQDRRAAIEDKLEQKVRSDRSLSKTEREAIIQARRGQGLFKRHVQKIETHCRVTGVNRPEHLRASHCKPWRVATNAERLDGQNGLLLTPSIDHLFDRGLISFCADGRLLVSPVAHHESLERMGVPTGRVFEAGGFTSAQGRFLEYHRDEVFLSTRKRNAG